MATNVAEAQASRHHVINEIPQGRMAKAHLGKAESAEFQAEIGKCLTRARQSLGWTVDQLARELPPPAGADKRDARQVGKWEAGTERMQLDVVWAVTELRRPFVTELANLAGARIHTHIEF